MTKFLWLVLLGILIMGCDNNHPLDIEYEVDGTEGLKFWGCYGDTLNSVNVDLNATVPTSLEFILYENEMAICNLSKHEEANENDTLIINLYVDGELFGTDTTTDFNTITLCYPEYPE